MPKKYAPRMVVFASSTFLLLLADLAISWDLRFPLIGTLVHILLATSIILAAHFLMWRSFQAFAQTEQVLSKAHKELETQVAERTAELTHLNESLRSEIAEREKAEIDRENLLDQNETARLHAMELVNDLHLANNMLTTLIETLPAGMVIIDIQGETVLENSHARSFMKNAATLGYYGIHNNIALRGKDGQLLAREQQPLVRAMQGITTNGLEVAVQMKNGETVHLLIAASPVRDKEGQITHAVEIMQDITPLKELENALRQSEEKYHTQFDAFSEATTVWDRNGFLLMQNLVSARNLDGKSEDFIGKSILEIFPGTGIDYLERIERVIDSGKIEYQEDTLETPAGMRTYWTCTQRIQSPSGTTAAQMIAYDITERRRIEDVLRSSEEKFSTVFHYAPYPISIIRLGDGVFLESNQAFCKILNQDHLEVIGQTWNHFGFTPMKADLNRIIEMMKQEGKVTDYELALDRPGLLPIVLLLSINPIVIGGKKCALLVGHDITERKLSEEALRLAQIELTRGLQERTALQERQRLARELHDSVSQVLYGISLGTHTALALFETERAKSLDALTYVLSLAQAGMTEMRALIFELRPESLKNEGLVNAINKQAAALRARHGIEVDLSLCEEPDISMDEKEAIYRITLEAIQNALKHARCSHINVDMRSDLAGLYLQVKDNGIGFDPAKNYPGHLGLQSMRERAANISAELTITSEIALGTCIQVLIPAKEPEVIVN